MDDLSTLKLDAQSTPNEVVEDGFTIDAAKCANRIFHPLQELTYHYNYSVDKIRDSNDNIKKKNCYCGSEECTGRIASRLQILEMTPEFIRNYQYENSPKSSCLMQSLILMKADKENDGKVWIIFRVIPEKKSENVKLGNLHMVLFLSLGRKKCNLLCLSL
ncbi:Histone-lysine N-methyltransferase, H3 lysine-9 specific SUVH5 [Camellia lanceoleosa]|uniref:Histone-lysine N-methyltransferase, H3 lysine-9 specific SUVH5 n=1 Tax=Camellia lanceoleosa TaxID=1840588 RepID=A0ACC0GIQ7_9ERIC|nr:Histone-lysine N-methyltransferase, H3 lysine-9 specific SUVH5 [Camellia lanceoleosa]